MLRPAIVSAAVLCALFATADAAPKSPNFVTTPKIAIPKPLAANRILVLPRNIMVPLQDEADNSMTKKKKKKKNIASTGKSLGKKKKPADIGNVATETLGVQTAPAASSSHGLQIPDQLKGVLDPDAIELARLRERFENENINDDGSFDALGTLFPENETDPKDRLGGNSFTTGSGDDSDHPGHSLDDIAAGFAGQGSGDDRRRGDEPSGSDGPNGPFHEDNDGDAGWPAIGALNTGIADPSGQVSQRNRGSRWSDCGAGCRERTTVVRERGRAVADRYERRDQTGRTTTTTDRGTGHQETEFVSSHWAYPSYNSESEMSANGGRIEWIDYEDPARQDEIVSTVMRPDGSSEERRTPWVHQPAGEQSSRGPSTWHEAGFYHVHCSARSCDYTPFTMQEIVTRMGVRVNPGGMEQPESTSTGPRVTPGAATDPHPDDVTYGRSGSQRPIGRGCAGMIRC